MLAYRVLVSAVISAGIVSAACYRSPAPEPANSETNAAVDRAIDLERERTEAIADLQERTNKLERDYAENNSKVVGGARSATSGLREELKEDVANVKEAVAGLSTTTAENWWDRHEQAMKRTADDIEADVHRLAGRVATPHRNEPVGTRGVDASPAPFTSRRDVFVADLRARADAMEQALDKVNARGARETELEDTRARVKKLREDVDRLQSAEAEDWWDVTKARVTDYVDRVEASVGRLDNDKPANR